MYRLLDVLKVDEVIDEADKQLHPVVVLDKLLLLHAKLASRQGCLIAWQQVDLEKHLVSRTFVAPDRENFFRIALMHAAVPVAIESDLYIFPVVHDK